MNQHTEKDLQDFYDSLAQDVSGRVDAVGQLRNLLGADARFDGLGIRHRLGGLRIAATLIPFCIAMFVGLVALNGTFGGQPDSAVILSASDANAAASGSSSGPADDDRATASFGTSRSNDDDEAADDSPSVTARTTTTNRTASEATTETTDSTDSTPDTTTSNTTTSDTTVSTGTGSTGTVSTGTVSTGTVSSTIGTVTTTPTVPTTSSSSVLTTTPMSGPVDTTMGTTTVTTVTSHETTTTDSDGSTTSRYRTTTSEISTSLTTRAPEEHRLDLRAETLDGEGVAGVTVYDKGRLLATTDADGRARIYFDDICRFLQAKAPSGMTFASGSKSTTVESCARDRVELTVVPAR